MERMRKRAAEEGASGGEAVGRGGGAPAPGESAAGGSAPAVPALDNARVARLLHQAASLLEADEAVSFRVRAYRNAARLVEEMTGSVVAMAREDPAGLRALPGVGATLAAAIEEIAQTGTLGILRRLCESVPEGTLELLTLPGLAPKQAKRLARELGVRGLADLERAARAGRLRDLRGFGPATEKRILERLAEHAATGVRVLRPTAEQDAQSLARWLRGAAGVTAVEIAGPQRRCADAVGGIVLVACAARAAPVVERFAAHAAVTEVLDHEQAAARVRLRDGVDAVLHVVPDAGRGTALFLATGVAAHVEEVQAAAAARGLRIDERGVWRGRQRVGGTREDEAYDAAALPWIPPELREGRGEVAAARARRLPRLVERADVRGDLQTHSTHSDGRDTMEAMAEAARALGYEYIAFTDHTPFVRVAGGMGAAGFRDQMRRIDRLNRQFSGITVLKGVECDILADGSLDLDDVTLDDLDLVLVSLHSQLDLPEPEQTRRVLRALRHRSVDVFAHPRGRKVLSRRGAIFDLEAVCRAAREQGVLLEVNGHPERLDMDGDACRTAIEQGVGIVISTDAHSVRELANMRWGVEQARRGWAAREQVANTRSLPELLKLLHRGRRR